MAPDHDAIADPQDAIVATRFAGDWVARPRWTGYTIGYHATHCHLAQYPDVTVEEGTSIDARTLLAESGHDGRCPSPEKE